MIERTECWTMQNLKRISLFFLVSCMLVLGGCGTSGGKETVTESIGSDISVEAEETDNSFQEKRLFLFVPMQGVACPERKRA